MEDRLRANIFPGAWPAVEPWRKFKWDRGRFGIRTWQPNSSQALCIDVFGTIKASPHRDLVMDALADRLGVAASGPWQVEFEWVDPDNRINLNEKRRTQVDVMARCDNALVLFECKFTEPDSGSCSRPVPKPDSDGLAECNGNYEYQTDPIRYSLFDYYGIPIPDEKCALTRIGIRYWRFLPDVMRLDPSGLYRPCPLNSPFYQLARNILLSWRVASKAGLRPAFAVVYAYGQGLPMSDRIRSKSWDLLMAPIRKDVIRVDTLTFQQVVQIALVACGDAGFDIEIWIKLERWITAKIARVSGNR